MVELTRIFYFIFAFLSIGGGYMGFRNKNSKASLIAGAIAGLVLLACGVFMSGTDHGPPLVAGLFVCILLAGKFVPDALTKRSFMPAGLMALLSVVGIILSLLSLYGR